jgi:hypothetical protein
MIAYLKQYFDPTQARSPKTSLAIRSGKGGARLSHDHSKQYAYVLQSLTLWREILHGLSQISHLLVHLLMQTTIRYVPLVVVSGTRSVVRKHAIPPSGYRPRSEPCSSRTQDIPHDAFHPSQGSTKCWDLDRFQCDPYGGS